MSAVRLQRPSVSAVVDTVGASLRSLAVHGHTLVDAPEEPAASEEYHGAVLAPWPNRLRDGRYRFGEVDHSVPVNEPATGCALHGLVAQRPWQVDTRGPDRVALSLRIGDDAGYPFPSTVRATYELTAAGVSSQLSLTNDGDVPMPAGLGVHPYLDLATTVDDVVVTVPARRRLTLDARQLPDGADPWSPTEFAIASAQVDWAFVDLERAADDAVAVTVLDGHRRVVVWGGATCRSWMLFSGDTLAPPRRRRVLAVEPMTCPPDAFTSGADLVTLDAGQTLTLAWGIRLDEDDMHPPGG